MADTPYLRVAATNETPLTSCCADRRTLRLIEKGDAPVSSENPVLYEKDILGRVKTLQGLLKAEAGFLAALRARAQEKYRYPGDEKGLRKLLAQLNHENIFHLARFFFLLKATNCDTPNAVELLLKDHNRKIRSMIEARDFEQCEEGELKKAGFSGGQIHDCVDSVGIKRRPVFTRAEIAKLLFEHMSRDSVLRMIDALVDAGLLFEDTFEPLKGAPRKLIQTDGFLERIVAQYLADVKENV